MVSSNFHCINSEGIDILSRKKREIARSGIFYKKLLVGIYNVYSKVNSNIITVGTSAGNTAKGADFPFILC